MANTEIGVTPLHKGVFVNIYDDGIWPIQLGSKTFYSLPDTDFGPDSIYGKTTTKHPGIRPRWARIVAVSNEAEEAGFRIGQKVLLEHLDWSRAAWVGNQMNQKFWRVDYDKILGVDDDGFTSYEKSRLSGWNPHHESSYGR